MHKKIGTVLLIISLLMACTGCGEKQETSEEPQVPESTQTAEETEKPEAEVLPAQPENPQPEPSAREPETPQTLPEPAQVPAAPEDGLAGTFTLDSSGQFSSSTCHLRQMDGALVLFELDVMEGSEGENQASKYIIAGTMLLNEQGTEGVYEPAPEALDSHVLHFAFDEDGAGFTVTAQDGSDFTPSGHYTFMEKTMQASGELAAELVRQLPTAATSLSGKLGDYALEGAEDQALGGSYRIDAVLADSGEIAASFLVSKDLTCVIRVDAEPEPTLIWGSTEGLPEASALE